MFSYTQLKTVVSWRLIGDYAVDVSVAARLAAQLAAQLASASFVIRVQMHLICWQKRLICCHVFPFLLHNGTTVLWCLEMGGLGVRGWGGE